MTGSDHWTTCLAQWASSSKLALVLCQVAAHLDQAQMTGPLELDHLVDLAAHPEAHLVAQPEGSKLQRELASRVLTFLVVF